MFVADDDEAFACFRDEVGRPDLAADDEQLAEFFLTRTAQAWEAAGVGCVVADAMSHFAFLFEDPQAQAIEMMTPVEPPQPRRDVLALLTGDRVLGHPEPGAAVHRAR